MNNEKELAYRYDLLITPDWRDRFDSMVNEKVKLPQEGRILDVNCGTGAHTIELAELMRGKGEVLGVDPNAERLEIARAKAQVKKVQEVMFEQSLPYDLRFESDEFDAVIGDASLMPENEIQDMLGEMIRVAAYDGPVVLKMATHGSFDEFFSVYWEALHDAGLDEKVWSDLETLIGERSTVSNAVLMAERAGLRKVESFTRKEEFLYETADEFFSSPLIEDIFLPGWLDIVPEDRRREVYDSIVEIIERERNGAPFDVSIKATLITGVK